MQIHAQAWEVPASAHHLLPRLLTCHVAGDDLPILALQLPDPPPPPPPPPPLPPLPLAPGSADPGSGQGQVVQVPATLLDPVPASQRLALLPLGKARSGLAQGQGPPRSILAPSGARGGRGSGLPAELALDPQKLAQLARDTLEAAALHALGGPPVEGRPPAPAGPPVLRPVTPAKREEASSGGPAHAGEPGAAPQPESGRCGQGCGGMDAPACAEPGLSGVRGPDPGHAGELTQPPGPGSVPCAPRCGAQDGQAQDPDGELEDGELPDALACCEVKVAAPSAGRGPGPCGPHGYLSPPATPRRAGGGLASGSHARQGPQAPDPGGLQPPCTPRRGGGALPGAGSGRQGVSSGAVDCASPRTPGAAPDTPRLHSVVAGFGPAGEPADADPEGLGSGPGSPRAAMMHAPALTGRQSLRARMRLVEAPRALGRAGSGKGSMSPRAPQAGPAMRSGGSMAGGSQAGQDSDRLVARSGFASPAPSCPEGAAPAGHVLEASAAQELAGPASAAMGRAGRRTARRGRGRGSRWGGRSSDRVGQLPQAQLQAPAQQQQHPASREAAMRACAGASPAAALPTPAAVSAPAGGAAPARPAKRARAQQQRQASGEASAQAGAPACSGAPAPAPNPDPCTASGRPACDAAPAVGAWTAEQPAGCRAGGGAAATPAPASDAAPASNTAPAGGAAPARPVKRARSSLLGMLGGLLGVARRARPACAERTDKLGAAAGGSACAANSPLHCSAQAGGRPAEPPAGVKVEGGCKAGAGVINAAGAAEVPADAGYTGIQAGGGVHTATAAASSGQGMPGATGSTGRVSPPADSRLAAPAVTNVVRGGPGAQAISEATAPAPEGAAREARGAAAAAAAGSACLGAGIEAGAPCRQDASPDAAAVELAGARMALASGGPAGSGLGSEAGSGPQAEPDGRGGGGAACPGKLRLALLVPCRPAMRGRFPLNGTYFQVQC